MLRIILKNSFINNHNIIQIMKKKLAFIKYSKWPYFYKSYLLINYYKKKLYESNKIKLNSLVGQSFDYLGIQNNK